MTWAILVSWIGIGGSIARAYAGLVGQLLLQGATYSLGLRAVSIFIRGELPRRGWARFGPWLFAIVGPLAVNGLVGYPLSLRAGGRLFQLATIIWSISVLVVIARGYRRADPILRRQTRWLALGFYLAMAPGALITAIALGDKLVTGEVLRTQWLLARVEDFGVLIPISMLFAIARYNVFDVDRLLSATASYNVVIVVLLAVGLVVVPRLAEAASPLLGVEADTGQIALSLALAAIVVPAYRRLRPRIDRVFFKEHYALERGIAELLARLSTCGDARSLTDRVGEGLARLFSPQACVVYAAAEETFQPIFVEGRAVPPAFASAGPLVATLRDRRAPLSLSDAGRHPDTAPLGPFDRAALQALDAEVVLAIHRQTLAAFLCLGPKRSGDVYTATDLSLLSAVAETVSQVLRALDQEEAAREARELQHSLRRYVPGVVAEELAGGRDLESAEREVTVLFVDMRGYTSFAERSGAHEIFSTLNRYTEKVSRIVREHGGSIVEFHGDGLLAVFGAPRPLERKERAAVEAGREILEGLAGELAVGIGIATGMGFVGNIRSSDRMIWSVVGNPTNLAARLQLLTREFEAAIAIDGRTHDRAGYVCADFVKHAGVRVRGRSEPQEVWALPLAHSPAKPD
jgi:class 3 adenylate cyclase